MAAKAINQLTRGPLPSNSDNIEWVSSTDPQRGPSVISTIEGSGGNTWLTVLDQPVNITGCLVMYAGATATPGIGTLSYTASTLTLTWAESGDTVGAGVVVSAGGPFQLLSANGNTLKVKIASASLPAVDAVDTITVSSQTIINPIICMAYNRYTLGSTQGNISAGDDVGAVWQIEGNWQSPGVSTVIEAYMEISAKSGANVRPFFTQFNKETEQLSYTTVQGGTSGIFLADYNDKHLIEIKDNTTTLYDVSSAATNLRMISSKQTDMLFYSNGDPSNGISSAQVLCDVAGTSDRMLQISITGLFGFASRSVGTTGVCNSFGSLGNDGVVNIDTANSPDNWVALLLRPSATSTTATIRQDSSTTVLNWALWPAGYVSVRESGGTVNRTPGIGTVAQTISTSWTNKPGATASTTPDIWFPMIDTAGALYWVPGFAN